MAILLVRSQRSAALRTSTRCHIHQNLLTAKGSYNSITEDIYNLNFCLRCQHIGRGNSSHDESGSHTLGGATGCPLPLHHPIRDALIVSALVPAWEASPE